MTSTCCATAAMGKVFDGVRAPSTFGTFLRTFTFGHVRQLDAVASRILAGLAAVGAAAAGRDRGDGLRRYRRHHPRGPRVQEAGRRVRLLRRQGHERAARGPVLADLRPGDRGGSRLRKGNAVSGHGAARLIGDAVGRRRRSGGARAGDGPGRLRLLPPRRHRRRPRAKAWFSVTVRKDPAVKAIAGIPEHAWTTIKYPRAI